MFNSVGQLVSWCDRVKNMNKEFETILSCVQKPGRYIGGEWNVKVKNADDVELKVALAFPDLYEIGMSYLGQKILYYLLNERENILAERVFAPWLDMEQELLRRNTGLCSIESGTPLGDFDVLGFSLLYELNYSNMLTMLSLSNIPFLSVDRGPDHPLVIAGGPAVFNPEPVADIFDLFLVGDGEEAFPELLDAYLAIKNKGGSKAAVLSSLSRIKGVYVPSLYTPEPASAKALMSVKSKDKAYGNVEKRILFPFAQAPYPEDLIVPNINIIFDRVAVEAARGCPQNCRFCQARSLYFPTRLREPEYIKQKMFKAVRSTGYEDASLAALSISDYPLLKELLPAAMHDLAQQKVSLSLSSLRPQGLTPNVVENILKVRKTGFTLVPEAGSDRLRRVINKHLQDSDIMEAAATAFTHGWRKLKLYFMLGLPTENEEDLQGIIMLVKEIIRLGYKILKKAPQINLSIASFIPKPHTPFQWMEMLSESELQQRHGYVKSELKKYPFVRFKEHPLKTSLLEAVFSRGDRRLTPVLIEAWKQGARFDSWGDQFDYKVWDAAFVTAGVDKTPYLSQLDRKANLPWDHIQTGLKKEYLLQELDLALKEKNSPICTDKSCRTCAGCDTGLMREKDFNREIKETENPYVIFGLHSEKVLRYRLIYAKRKTAKYVSHLDLTNIIQRSFRRAAIQTTYSQGFHPKMKIAFGPALPLGMQGNKEILEFRSEYEFVPADFIKHLNRFLPQGVTALSLVQIKADEKKLHEAITEMEYSYDLDNPELRSMPFIDMEMNVQKLQEYEESEAGSKISFFKFVTKENKLFFRIKVEAGRTIRIQDIIKEIFEVNNPVFYMNREQILLTNN